MSALLGYDKIKGLIYTEKSNQQLTENKYHFEVDASCRKEEIASLVKKIFGAEIKKVNIINTHSKTKRFKGVEGKRKSYKKAIVTLKEGQSINFGS
jgi:large subunit ribosomal protein L23